MYRQTYIGEVTNIGQINQDRVARLFITDLIYYIFSRKRLNIRLSWAAFI
jgi:hypothetical protein